MSDYFGWCERMRGLIIKSPWIDLILKGKKPWEIRGSNTTIRGTIALIKSGSGKVYGTVDLVDTKKLTFEEFMQSEEFHCIPKKDCVNVTYKNIYAWILENPKLFEEPLPYRHPRGAVIWVDLKDLKLPV